MAPADTPEADMDDMAAYAMTMHIPAPHPQPRRPEPANRAAPATIARRHGVLLRALAEWRAAR